MIVIVDIDGTIADNEHRSGPLKTVKVKRRTYCEKINCPYPDKDNFCRSRQGCPNQEKIQDVAWGEFIKAMDKDTPIPYSREVLQWFADLKGSEIFYLTARLIEESFYPTLKWLEDNKYPLSTSGHLIMKPKGDRHTDSMIFKLSVIRNIAATYDTKIITIDDSALSEPYFSIESQFFLAPDCWELIYKTQVLLGGSCESLLHVK